MTARWLCGRTGRQGWNYSTCDASGTPTVVDVDDDSGRGAELREELEGAARSQPSPSRTQQHCSPEVIWHVNVVDQKRRLPWALVDLALCSPREGHRTLRGRTARTTMLSCDALTAPCASGPPSTAPVRISAPFAYSQAFKHRHLQARRAWSRAQEPPRGPRGRFPPSPRALIRVLHPVVVVRELPTSSRPTRYSVATSVHRGAA
jgi:hypothetical protein